jgi:hypothetical protein
LTKDVNDMMEKENQRQVRYANLLNERDTYLQQLKEILKAE